MDRPLAESTASANVPPAPPAARPALWPQVLVLLLAVAACYANSLGGPFLLDDPRPGVRLDYRLRPVVWATFDLNRAISGERTWSFHVFNALVHVGAGFFLLGFLRRAGELVAPGVAARTRDGLAFATTLLWLCHPLQTGAVTYLSQRAEALAALSYLAVLYAFLRAATAARPRAWQALSLAALALGFATKEIVATAPLALWLFDALFLARGPLAALRLRPRFYGTLALATAGLALLFIVPPLLAEQNAMGLRYRAFGPLEYARTQAGVMLHYLRLVFWPHPQCFDPGWPIARAPLEWVPQTAAIAALLALAAFLCRRRSWVGYALACFFLVLAPTSSFVPIQDPAFEHRMYLPLAAILAPVVAGIWTLLRPWPGALRLAPVLAAGAALVLGAATVRRNRDYRSAVTLLERTVACAPHHVRARINLGEALLGEGRPEEAVAVLNEALRRDPQNGFVYENLGRAYLALGQVERAIPWLERAVESVPDPRFHEALGRAFLSVANYASAAPQLEAALGRPGDAPLRVLLAFALRQLGREEAALAQYRAALGDEPHAAGELLGLGRALRAGGKDAQARAAFEEAARVAPALRADALREAGE